MKFFKSKNGLAVLFLVCVIAAFAVRTWVCARELDRVRSETGTDFVPYSVESAIMHGYARDVADGKGLPEYDKRLGPLSNVKLSGQMSLGLEYYLGWSWRLKNTLFGKPEVKPGSTIYEDDPHFTSFCRYAIRWWLCLATGFIFLWLIALRCPLPLALCGAAFHIFSPAAIARYTGQDILRGNFALPFIAATFMLGAWALRKKCPGLTIAAGITAFCAVSFWDVSQLCLVLWALVEGLRLLISGRFSMKRLALWTTLYASVVLAAILVPYCREHKLLLSPLLMVIIPALLAGGWSSIGSKVRGRIAFIAGLLLCFVIWKIAAEYTGYSDAYSHFGELVKAKIKFLNSKPADPEQLSFAARFLWTPALHSATLPMTLRFFPGSLLCFIMLLTGVLVIIPARKYFFKRGLPGALVPLVLTICFFTIYIFMVRYHVFAIFFGSVSIPLLANCLVKRPCCKKLAWFNVSLLLLLGLAAAIEMDSRIERIYRGQGIHDVARLIKRLRQEDARDRVILARMTVSPLLKDYCGATIVLQPKFELKKTRDLVEDYINIMYHGDEKLLAEYCLAHNVEFVVFYRDDCFGPLSIYSLPYMAAAKKVKKQAPAYMMDKYPDSMKYFYRLGSGKDKYLVFRFIRPGSHVKAGKMADLAMYYYQQNRPDLARKLAKAAYLLAPNSKKAYIAWFHIFGTVPNPKISDFPK